MAVVPTVFPSGVWWLVQPIIPASCRLHSVALADAGRTARSCQEGAQPGSKGEEGPQKSQTGGRGQACARTPAAHWVVLINNSCIAVLHIVEVLQFDACFQFPHMSGAAILMHIYACLQQWHKLSQQLYVEVENTFKRTTVCVMLITK